MIKQGDTIQFGRFRILCIGGHVDWYNAMIKKAKHIKKECNFLYKTNQKKYDEILNIKIL